MSLGFTINASPLSQISVAISDIATAVQLATGVYGWWKSNERSQSLDQALTTAGGHLVASSAFNLQCYKDIRQCHHVLGAVVGEGTIRTVALPRASTAISDDPGRTCLRALTTALLCLYTTEATVMILADVLPSCLIQLHQEDATFEISGPLFASLKDAVHAIAKEEENDTLGKYLLEQACDDKVILFAGTDDSLRPNLAEHLHEKDLADIALVAGALRWALTSSIQRPSTTYITRSLNVWVLVGMMQRLGFEIMASPVLHAPRAMSDRRDETSTAQDKIASVVLNVTSQGQTDPWEHGVARAGSEDNNFSRPLLTDVATVPWLIHKHLGVRCGASCEYLTQVFNHARLKVKDMDSSLTIMDGQLTLGLSMLANGYPDSSNRFHAGFGMLVNNWSQIGPPLPFHARFPEYTRLAWTVADSFLRTADEALFRSSSRVKAAIRIYRTMPTVQNDSGETLTPIQIFEALFPHSAIQSLMLGSCYGILSHFVLGDKRDDSELDSVAFSPLLLKKELQSGRFSRLLDNFNKLLTGTANYEDLLGSMAKLILGWSQDLPHNKARRDQELILGLQSNGLSILSQFALDPTLDTHSLYRFRVTDGLIVNLPVTENNSVIMHRCLPNKEQTRHYAKTCIVSASSRVGNMMAKRPFLNCGIREESA
ncbi:hypothetical protein OHC33_009580 [Knufia fluminis]|uniref:Uncharacterized protein n=1 Tax=Knufia fluminis TaxID=191047 RepID=A0AAN8EFC1_9EURO|nr:hypothetical protein OHC33_009580 [Knufia fluminis]